MSRRSNQQLVLWVGPATALLLVSIAGVAGCGGSCSTCRTRTFTAQLLGSEVVPPVATGATAKATMLVDPVGPTMDMTIDWRGLTNVTRAQVRIADVGENGPVILRIHDAATDGPFANPYTKHVTEADMRPQPSLGLTTCKAVCDAIAAGQTYLAICTEANPDGEIRGQILTSWAP